MTSPRARQLLPTITPSGDPANRMAIVEELKRARDEIAAQLRLAESQLREAQRVVQDIRGRLGDAEAALAEAMTKR